MNIKVILFLIILIIFLYKFKQQQEGFSSAEKDIRAYFDMRGVFIKKDKQGKICKIGEKNKHMKKNKKDEKTDIIDTNEVDKDTKDVDVDKIKEGRAIILEKESEQNTQELLKLNNKLETMQKSHNEALEESQTKNNRKIIDNLKQLIDSNEQKELEKMNELTNKINLLHSELQNSKEKEKMFDKLLDKIHTVPPVIRQPSQKSNGMKQIILFIVLFVLFSLGGLLIYNITMDKQGENRVSGTLTTNYKDELLRAKKKILSEVI